MAMPLQPAQLPGGWAVAQVQRLGCSRRRRPPGRRHALRRCGRQRPVPHVHIAVLAACHNEGAVPAEAAGDEAGRAVSRLPFTPLRLRLCAVAAPRPIWRRMQRWRLLLLLLVLHQAPRMAQLAALPAARLLRLAAARARVRVARRALPQLQFWRTPRPAQATQAGQRLASQPKRQAVHGAQHQRRRGRISRVPDAARAIKAA